MPFLYSYGFVIGILLLTTLLEKRQIVGDEGARKLIHVAVAHWYILAMFTFDNAFLVTIIPLTFVLINYLSHRFNLLSAMERDQEDRHDLGTVYYAISLTIITFIAFYFDYRLEGLFAVLAMGYGDGFGAILGKRYGKKKVFHHKSYVGSFAMLFFTLLIGLIIFSSQWHFIILIAVIATFLEMFTVNGYDNLSVPLMIFFLSVVIL